MKFKLKGPEGFIEVYIPRSMVQLSISIARIVGYETMTKCISKGYILAVEKCECGLLKKYFDKCISLARLIPLASKEKELKIVQNLIPNPDTFSINMVIDNSCLETEVSTGTLALMFYDSLSSWVENPVENEKVTDELVEILCDLIDSII